MTNLSDHRLEDELLDAVFGGAASTSNECGFCVSCLSVCLVSAIILGADGPIITDSCVGCGECVDICPSGAIS